MKGCSVLIRIELDTKEAKLQLVHLARCNNPQYLVKAKDGDLTNKTRRSVYYDVVRNLNYS